MKYYIKPKIYEVKYDFLYKNYLDKKCWKKEWVVFTHNNIEVTLKLFNIHIAQNCLTLEIKGTNNIKGNNSYSYINLPLDTRVTEKMYKNRINTAIQVVLGFLENKLIAATPEMKQAKELDNRTDEMLRQRAVDYLDKMNITDNYLVEALYEKIDADHYRIDYVSEVRDELKYTKLTETWYAFGKFTEDDTLLSKLENKVSNMEEIKEDMQEIVEQIESGEYYDLIEVEGL